MKYRHWAVLTVGYREKYFWQIFRLGLHPRYYRLSALLNSGEWYHTTFQVWDLYNSKRRMKVIEIEENEIYKYKEMLDSDISKYVMMEELSK